ncbi:hypothetical protein LTS18_008348, partial [Coniosporium uncinatum]
MARPTFLELRKRFTLRNIFIFFVIFQLLNFLSFNMPLLSSRLPQYTGPHAVGAIDLEADCTPRVIGDILLKKTNEPALKLETVFFTLYYPASPSGYRGPLKHHPWVPKPVSLIATGYARFAHITNSLVDSIFTFFLWLLVGSTSIPADVDAPLLVPLSSSQHGLRQTSLGGSETTLVDTASKFPI